MSSISTAFTSATVGAALALRPGESASHSITGTFVGTLQLEKLIGSGAYRKVAGPFTTTESGTYRNEGSEIEQVRWQCTAYTSGTATAVVADVSNEKMVTPQPSEWKTADGRVVLRVDEDGVEVFSRKQNGVALSNLLSVDVTCAASALDSAGQVTVVAAGTGINATDQYKIRGITLVGGGTNFGAGGDRLLDLTDGTTVWTTVANADLESAPAASLPWGNAKVPMLTNKSDVASAAGAKIYFAYSGGTTDHSATGSIKFNVLLEKVA